MEAVSLWRLFPGEIASDLSRFHHRRIADWHDGTMRSHELLELCEHMPVEGAFKTALRRGGWTEYQTAVYQIANELTVLRTAQVQGVTSEDLGSRLFIDPAKVEEASVKEADRLAATESVFSMTSPTTEED